MKVKCPVCENKKEFSVEFSNVEINQGGTNFFCPYCNWLLWVPVVGNPHPVPLINPLQYKTTKITEINLEN